MKCDELLKALNEYVDGQIDPAICEEFANHLAGCNPCQVVVDNIRNTIALYRSGERYEMPPEFHDRLRKQLREKWSTVFDGESQQNS
jgi:anti-sigma factor RsiW